MSLMGRVISCLPGEDLIPRTVICSPLQGGCSWSIFLATAGLSLCGFTKRQAQPCCAPPRDGTSQWSPSARSAWSASPSGCAPAASCPRCDASSGSSWRTFSTLRFSTAPWVKQAKAPVRSGAHPCATRGDPVEPPPHLQIIPPPYLQIIPLTSPVSSFASVWTRFLNFLACR